MTRLRIPSRRRPFTRESSCAGKQRYGEAHAARVARISSRRYNEPFHAYPCLYCGRFHVGHRNTF